MTSTAAGTYTYAVKAFVIDRCASEITTVGIITIENPVTVEIAGNTVICENAEGATLYAITNPIDAQNIVYQWYLNGQSLEDETGANFDISTLGASALGYNFMVRITDTVSGCTFLSDIHYVYVGQLATIGITANPLSVCPGEQVLLTANIALEDNMTYAWLADGVQIGDAPNAYHTPAITTTYTFVATQVGTGCTAASNPVTVTVVPVAVPVLTISETMICDGGQVTISGDVEGLYTWRRNGIIIATDADNVITEQLTASNVLTTYTYTAMVSLTHTNACEPQYSAPVSVTVHPTMGVTIVGAHEVCTQATEDAHMWLHAIVDNLQEGVTYTYTLMYTQGEGEMTVLADYYEPIDMPVPNWLPANDYAAPYNFFVKVTAHGYECTAMSIGHEVNILTQPTVQIAVNSNAICLGGAVTVTAHPTPAPTPENPYNYVWTVDGVDLPFNEREITINDLPLGTNNITVRVERAYGSASCFGSNTIQVAVYELPTLELTQDYDGMCVGGRVSLTASIDENFQGTEMPFTYHWERDGYLIPNVQSGVYTEELNSTGIYQYRVRVTNALGCNTEWFYFDPIKVVPQPTLTIERLGAQYDVCKEAEVEITVNLNITDPNIQNASQYAWNDGVADVYPIYSRIIEGFTNTGIHRYSLEISFENPTCMPAVSNELLFTVVESPRWANLDVNPKWELCLGGDVDLRAQFLQGTTNDINIGTIQWQYSHNGGTYVDEPYIYVGGDKTHRPLEAGEYTYRVNYNPSNPSTGCELASVEFGPLTVLSAPTASFANAEVPQIICANDLGVIDLVINFTGTPPFVFRVEGPNGFSMNRSTTQNTYTFPVTTPGIYRIAYMNDQSSCPAILFLDTEIEVAVSDVAVDSYVSACGPTAIVNVNITSIVYYEATVEFVGTSHTQTKPIVNNAITIDVPAALPAGRYDVIITIDGCTYPTVVHIGNPIDGLTARFVDAPMLEVCTDGSTPVALEIEFTGIPPFYYMVAENGSPLWDAPRIAYTYEATVVVVPTVTSVYRIISLANDAGCEILTETTMPEIMVTIGDIDIVSSVLAACEGDVATIEIISTITTPGTITFGTLVQDINIIPGHNIIDIEIPANTLPGIHNVTITIGRLSPVLQQCEYVVAVVYAANTANNGSLIHRRWEGYGEVLVVSNNYCDPASPYYNGGIEFTTYQWYKNGKIIPGATQQYYQDPAGVNGEYSVYLTGFRVIECTDGVAVRGEKVEFTTCAQPFNPTNTIKVYPVPAKVNQPVTVELDLSMEELVGAVLDIYDAKGAHVQQIQVVSKITQVDGFRAQGTYFGRITTGTNEIKSVKFLIVN